MKHRQVRLVFACFLALLTAAPHAQAAPAPAATCNGDPATLVGTAGPDVIEGTADRDVIWGGGGADVIEGSGGDDIICGGRGDDVIHGDAGHDQIFGDAGDDRLFGGDDDDYLVGLAGADELDGGSGADYIDGGAGNDRASAGDDAGGTPHCGTFTLCDILEGGPGDDVLDGADGATPDIVGYRQVRSDALRINLARGTARGEGRDTLLSMEGVEITGTTDDRVIGTAANNIFFTGDGSDVVRARGGDDFVIDSGDSPTGFDDIRTGAGNDAVVASTGSDRIDTGRGDDRVRLDGSQYPADPRIRLGAGDDFLETGSVGAEFRLTVWGGRGNDGIEIGDAPAVLYGGPGADRLRTGWMNDRLDGGAGVDIGDAGDGQDVCQSLETAVGCET
jgi:Ca2+-binding RTX toxin-like protein